MPNTSLISYATPRFESVRGELESSARRFAINNFFSYSDRDLHASNYYNENRSILDEPCGAGYWAWKPYFILEALNRLSDGDILFYADAGSLFVQSPAPLIEICAGRPDGLVVFDARPLTNAQFTKRDCFVRLGCDDPRIWESTKSIATLLVIKKCPRSQEILNLWCGHCKDRAAITDDPNVCGKPNRPEFLVHRWDQAILSVLVAREGIETYRNPTLWGNYLKMKNFRVAGEMLRAPYDIPPQIHGYSKKPQLNSPYGTLFEINRAPNHVGKPPLPSLEHLERGPARSLSQNKVARLSMRAIRKAASLLGLS